jgi:hypothetical protein
VPDALRQRFERAALRPAGEPRGSISPPTAARFAGVPASAWCGRGTRCDALRFHSYRRDGAAAGRLLSWIEAPEK